MSWKRLAIADLRTALSEEELSRLENVSTELSATIQDTLDQVADMFRNAWAAKGYAIDSREHYVDSGYVLPILNYARWQLWTRFPMAENYSLSEPREKGYTEAVELLKNPYLATSKPDSEPTPGPDVPSYVSADASIKLPYQRFPAFPMSNGFWQVYEWPLNFSTP